MKLRRKLVEDKEHVEQYFVVHGEQLVRQRVSQEQKQLQNVAVPILTIACVKETLDTLGQLHQIFLRKDFFLQSGFNDLPIYHT